MPADALTSTDAFGRPAITEPIRQSIADAFRNLEGRAALLIIADDRGTRAHLAAKLGKHWKVAGGPGWEWAATRPSGWVSIEATW